MQLTDLEKTLGGIILTMIGTCILYIKAAYGKVSKKECQENRDKGCSTSQKVMLVEEKINTIERESQETKQGIIRLHEKIDLVLIQTAGRNK